MKEITFLKQNYQRWQQFEDLLNSGRGTNPDALADLFIRITNDLSWAQTFYPGSNTEKYLNDLAARIHQEIYKNKKEKRSRIFSFWTTEIPLIMAKNRRNLLIAFLIFFASTWIGVISAQHDSSFVRLIMGDGYVDMTLENMKHGDPLGVYKSDNQFVMFFTIFLNNAIVSIVCILFGFLGWFGVAFMQFRNGVMLGAFFTLLASHGFMHEATFTVWVHGTIEIFSIVVAGTAGVALGNGLWFPGAWPRGVSFVRGTREALKIGIALIPFFATAAFFEGFITRHTEISDYVRGGIIITSLVFMVWYFIVWPYFVERQQEEKGLLFFSMIPLLGRLMRLFRIADRQVTPRFAFQLVVGFVLVVLPVLGFGMAIQTKHYPDMSTIVFFLLMFFGGITMFIFAALLHKQVDEEELKVERKKKLKADYDRTATSVKI